MSFEESSAGVLERIVPRDDYQARRKPVFPSLASLDWYIRVHRTDLIACDAITFIGGRWLIDPPAFDAHVRKTGAAAAAKKVPA